MLCTQQGFQAVEMDVGNSKVEPQSRTRCCHGSQPTGEQFVSAESSGTPVANFSLATNEWFKDRNDEWRERTEWHSIVAWQRLAEIVGEYVAKGCKLYVEGKIQTSSWEDRQSEERKYRTEIVARDLLLLGPRENSGGDCQRPTHNQNQDQLSHAGSGEIVDQDIPF